MLSVRAQPFSPQTIILIGERENSHSLLEKHKDFFRTFSEEDLLLFWKENTISALRLIEEDSSLPSLSDEERAFLEFHHMSLLREVLGEKMVKNYLKMISFDPSKMNIFLQFEQIFTKMALIQGQFLQGLQRENHWFKQCSPRSKKGILRESIRSKHIESEESWTSLDFNEKQKLIDLLSDYEDYILEFYSK